MKTVVVVAKYGDKTSIGVIDIIDFTVNIDENEVNDFNIYPNPARDIVKLSAVSGQLSVIKIYNCLGMIVEEIEVNANDVEINVSGYKSGVYFINIESAAGYFTEKLMIE
jgi:hypothetical protein